MGEPWPTAAGAAALRPGADAALALHARVLQARTATGAAQALVTGLAADFGLDRASLALADPARPSGSTRLRLLASTGPDRPEIAGTWRDQVLGALDEALDQGQVLAWPPAADADPSDPALRFELRQLQQTCGGAVAALPMGRQGRRQGGLCVERQGGTPFDDDELARLSACLALAGPALHWMQRAELPWHRRTRDALVHALHRLREPDQRLQRRLWVAGLGLFAVLAGVPMTHEVGGRARLEGAEQRVLSAPTDGFVKTAHVRPGDRVAAGTPLLDLLEDDLRLEQERWASQLAQHENAYAAAMGSADRIGAATAMARVSEAQAQLSLVEERLARGRLTAPFDGVVIAGDLSQAIGAPVRQGDALVTLASAARFRVIVEVDETAIARVQPGQTGRLSLSALPWQGEDIVVERVAPMARAVEGRNVFDVQARLVAPDATLRPGLLGRAELDVGHRPPLWVWLGRAADRLRVAWWSWIG